MTAPFDLLAGLPTSEPADVREARVTAQLTQRQAAALAGLGDPMRWSDYECGRHAISAERWALFLLATGQHPTLRIAKRRTTVPPG